MSLIWPLERLFESPAKIEERQREKQGAAHAEANDEEGDPPTFRCRVCGYEGPQRVFCPDCLADTMVALEPARR